TRSGSRGRASTWRSRIARRHATCSCGARCTRRHGLSISNRAGGRWNMSWASRQNRERSRQDRRAMPDSNDSNVVRSMAPVIMLARLIESGLHRCRREILVEGLVDERGGRRATGPEALDLDERELAVIGGLTDLDAKLGLAGVGDLSLTA